MNYRLTILIVSFLITPAMAITKSAPAITQPIITNQLQNFTNYPPIVKQAIISAKLLTEKNLTYTYGSANPDLGGMDCSGTINYLLKKQNVPNVPRQASEIYRWVWEQGKFYAVTSHNFQSFEFSKLQPGDLLFWTGTSSIIHDPPITHVMMYLGKDTQGRPLMFGSSDGRTYQGKKMWGVSVFDFMLPGGQSTARFVGYSCIPDLTCHETSK